MKTESWLQPPISMCAVYVEGDDLWATELDDPSGEFNSSNHINGETFDLASQDIEDIEDTVLYEQTVDEPTIAWDKLKEELDRDGIL